MYNIQNGKKEIFYFTCLSIKFSLKWYYIESSELTFLINQRRSWPMINQDRSGIWSMMSISIRNLIDDVNIDQEHWGSIKIGPSLEISIFEAADHESSIYTMIWAMATVFDCRDGILILTQSRFLINKLTLRF